MSSTALPVRQFTLTSSNELSLSTLFSQAGLASMALGFASGIPVQGLGRLYIGEVALVAVAPIVALILFGLSNQFGRTARMLLIAMIVSWVGYLISDFVRGTAPNDYLRGWSRWISMGASFVTLAWIASKRIGYLCSFLVGLSIGGCAAPYISGGFLASSPINYWKFHAGIPICILVLVATCRLRPIVSIAALVGLGALSIVLDTRSIALLCIFTAGFTWLTARRSKSIRQLSAPPSVVAKVAAVGVLVLILFSSLFVIQQLGSKYGYSQRFENSNSARRISAITTWMAIKRSPLVGYGSWPRDAEIARERDKLVSKAKNSRTERSVAQQNLIIAHSQILQGWLEGGLLGLVFFVVLGWQLGKQLLWQAARSPHFPMTSLIVFVQLHCAWHLVFSPFSGAQRVYIPTACVMICYLAEQAYGLEAMRRLAIAGRSGASRVGGALMGSH
jgi:hypothetical protein